MGGWKEEKKMGGKKLKEKKDLGEWVVGGVWLNGPRYGTLYYYY